MNLSQMNFNVGVAAISTALTAALGGWDAALKALLAFMILDYVTGILAAIRNKQLNSEVMFWGGIRKGAVLAVVAIAVILDQTVGNKEPIFRTLAVYFYVAREGLSVTENLGLLGVPLPGFITKVLSQLQEKGEVK